MPYFHSFQISSISLCCNFINSLKSFKFDGTEHFWIIFDDRGRHWKGILTYSATKINVQHKTFVLMNKNVFLNTAKSPDLNNKQSLSLYFVS